MALLGNSASFLNGPRRGPHRNLAPMVLVPGDMKRRQGYQAGFQRSCVKVDVYEGWQKPLNWTFLRQTAV